MIPRIAGIVGLLALWVLDVAHNNSSLANGFWEISQIKGFHLALWTATAALIFIILWPNDKR